jgi:hypothetical protein
MKTVLELPSTYKKTCTVTINNRDEDIVLRNAIILLLAFHFPNGEASELIVHLWYSAALPSNIYRQGIPRNYYQISERFAEHLHHSLVVILQAGFGGLIITDPLSDSVCRRINGLIFSKFSNAKIAFLLISLTCIDEMSCSNRQRYGPEMKLRISGSACLPSTT